MPKIYLSPSVQQQNVGVGNYGTEEKRCNEIADVVERELKKNSNFIVVRNNPNMSLNEVIADSNKSNSDIHFSIHTKISIFPIKIYPLFTFHLSNNIKISFGILLLNCLNFL